METGLPTGWEVRHSQSKNLPYYYDPSTQTSSWEPPAGTDSGKLKSYMAQRHTEQPATNNNTVGADGKINAIHLLVKHRESRRPSSWKDANITRSKEEARGILQGYESQIKSGSIPLGELAMSESDCSSARKQGDLGWFAKGEMQKEFEDAAFALKVGEISPIVDTASGLHLIQRVG